MIDVSKRDLTIKLFGNTLQMLIAVSPFGLHYSPFIIYSFKILKLNVKLIKIMNIQWTLSITNTHWIKIFVCYIEMFVIKSSI